MAKPRFSLLRTLGLTLALAAPIAAALYLEREFRPPAEAGYGESLLPEPWLELPGQASSLRSESTRRAFVRMLEMEAEFELLPSWPGHVYGSELEACSDESDIRPMEHHQVWVIPYSDPPRHFSLRLYGERAVLETSSVAYFKVIVPAPPADVADAPAAESEKSTGAQPRVSRARIQSRHLNALEGLRSALLSPEAWSVKQDFPVHHRACDEAPELLIASCVAGQLEVRSHRCDFDAQPLIERLLGEFDLLLKNAEASPATR